MTRLQGKHALLHQLSADGCRYVFGNPGTTEQAFMDALQDHAALQFILCLDERVAVSMADSYARVTRKPAFVELHIAPGLGNAGGMLYNARAGQTPLLVYAGQSASDALFQEPLLSGNLLDMARPFTKWAYQLSHAGDIPQAVRRALKTAAEPPQGPVLLSIPIDVMDEEAEVTVAPSPQAGWQIHPDPRAIDKTAAILLACRRPVIVVGDGVSLSDGQHEVGLLAHHVGAPIYQGYSSEVNVAPDHELLAGTLPVHGLRAAAATRRLMKPYDVVIAVGVPLFRFIFPDAELGLLENKTVIHVHADRWELGKNVPPDVSIHADCKVALKALLDRLQTARPLGATRRAAAIATGIRRRRLRALDADRRAWASTTISVPRLMGELAAVLPDDAALFDEATTASETLVRHVRLPAGRYFRARGGALGPGMPGPVALKLGLPDRMALGVVSDGAAVFTMSTLWTAAHYRIPATWVICNNGSYQILKQNLLAYLGVGAARRRFIGLDLVDPPLRYDRIAEAMGVAGRRVERPAQLRAALEWALSLGAPALLDVVIDDGHM